MAVTIAKSPTIWIPNTQSRKHRSSEPVMRARWKTRLATGSSWRVGKKKNQTPDTGGGFTLKIGGAILLRQITKSNYVKLTSLSHIMAEGESADAIVEDEILVVKWG